MPTLAHASLSEAEHRALDAIVAELQREFGPRLRSVWLYGSRARGETPHLESDVDVLIVVDRRTPEDGLRVRNIVWDATDAADVRGTYFSTYISDVERVAQRREIRSFFFQEVDRDKIVLYGEP